jgi:hypothetical protein
MKEEIHNGMPAVDVPGARWRKSSHSNPSGNCVEMTRLADGRVAVRNSRFPEGVALIYSADDFRAFVEEAKTGRLDDLLR